MECLDGLTHFQRIAHRVAQGLFHSGNQRSDFAPRTRANGDHQPGQDTGVVQIFHKSAPTTLHIQHNRIRTRGQFLAHNTGGDERQAGHSAGHIPQGIEPFVGWGQIGRLPGNDQTDLPQLLTETFFTQLRRPAADTLQFVDGAAAETQPPPAHLAHGQATGGHNRTDRQRRLVTHAAAGMFVHNQRAGCYCAVEVQGVAALGHGQGESGGLGVAHPPKVDGHGPGRQLVVGDGVVDHSPDEKAQFLRRVFAPIPLFGNQVNWIHRCGLLARPSWQQKCL